MNCEKPIYMIKKGNGYSGGEPEIHYVRGETDDDSKKDESRTGTDDGGSSSDSSSS